MPDPTESFVQNLTSSQNRLYGYIFSLVGDHHRAADILQESNIVLWRKSSEFRPGSDFIHWAFAIARFQVMANLRDKGRDRCVFDEELIELVSSELGNAAGNFDSMREALRRCLAKLPIKSRNLIDLRYFQEFSIKQVADEMNQSAVATKVALLRIRKGLRACVDRELAKES